MEIDSVSKIEENASTVLWIRTKNSQKLYIEYLSTVAEIKIASKSIAHIIQGKVEVTEQQTKLISQLWVKIIKVNCRIKASNNTAVLNLRPCNKSQQT